MVRVLEGPSRDYVIMGASRLRHIEKLLLYPGCASLTDDDKIRRNMANGVLGFSRAPRHVRPILFSFTRRPTSIALRRGLAIQ
jgi:hypothetical protein